MVAELITQCPKCQTSFKVKEEQLKVANGLVRCGSCLNVFNAVEYSALNSDAPIPPKLDNDTPIDIDDLFDQDTLSDIDQNFDIKDDSVNEFISTDTTKAGSDEDTGEQLLAIPDDMLEDDVEMDADELFGGEPIVESNTQEEDWAEQLLEELDSSSIDEDDAPEPTSTLTSQTSSDSFTEQKLDQPPHFESEPVYLNTESPEEKKNLAATIGWSAGSLLAVLLIVFQIGWLNFNSWSKLPELRSSYTLACAVIGCKLPEIRALDKIRASNLIVRSDNTNPQHLLIDAIITNQASFTQPYPKLALIFTDNDNKPVASGLISPSQYLGGELSGATIMEKNIPIHIAFKIKDPGATARSYRLELYSN